MGAVLDVFGKIFNLDDLKGGGECWHWVCWTSVLKRCNEGSLSFSKNNDHAPYKSKVGSACFLLLLAFQTRMRRVD